MDLLEFTNRVIEDGIAAAKEDYKDPLQKEKLEGSILGFERCRGKTPAELLILLCDAKTEMQKAFIEQAENYWFIACQEAEIEWVCNCVSAVVDPITSPTARGVLNAARILGG